MILFSLLLIVTVLATFIALLIFSIEGTIAVVFGADIIIAIFIIWWFFIRSRKK